MSYPPSEAADIRILIADDHLPFLKTLRQILEDEPGMQIVAECVNGTEALRKAAEVHPDIAVVDVDMPGVDGIEVAATLSALPRMTNLSGPRVILLTMHRADSLVRRARQVGVRGYVLKENAALEVVPAIRSVFAGSLFAGKSCSEFEEENIHGLF